MQFFANIALLGLSIGAGAAPTVPSSSSSPSTPENHKTYHLKTVSKPGELSAFNNLYLTAYHSGAGENDAVLLPSTTSALNGSLVKTNATDQDGHAFYNQVFNLSGQQYSLIPQPNTDFYAAWEPTVINIGYVIDPTDSGFWFNSTGLQWSSSPKFPGTGQFDGWLVCDWYRGVPQLFFTVAGEDRNIQIPSSCAKVNLVPEYL